MKKLLVAIVMLACSCGIKPPTTPSEALELSCSDVAYQAVTMQCIALIMATNDDQIYEACQTLVNEQDKLCYRK